MTKQQALSSSRTFSLVSSFAALLGFGLFSEGCSTSEGATVEPSACGSSFCKAGEACQNGVCVCPAGAVCDAGAVASGGASSTGTGGAASSAGGMSQTGSGGRTGGANSSGGAAAVACTNLEPPKPDDWPEATCEKWANETSECDSEWMIEAEYCNESCDRCSASSTGDGDGDVTGSGGGTATGQGNPWGGVSGGQEAWASRYWDCCKQSCGWSENAGGNPVKTCNSQSSSVVSSNDQSTCSGGQATTCNSFTPWAYSDEVSFGFVATHVGGAACGTCYHIEFTGQSENNSSDPGSPAIAGKTMIVMATNIGGDVGGNQMDLLIPGGGTGAFFGCGTAWGVDQKTVESLGEQYGGLRSKCGGGSLESVKSCVAGKCQELFGSRNLEDMYEGCMWYVNWLQAADNPKFRYETIECPAELKAAAY